LFLIDSLFVDILFTLEYQNELHPSKFKIKKLKSLPALSLSRGGSEFTWGIPRTLLVLPLIQVFLEFFQPQDSTEPNEKLSTKFDHPVG
jgi:hypothetical protein